MSRDPGSTKLLGSSVPSTPNTISPFFLMSASWSAWASETRVDVASRAARRERRRLRINGSGCCRAPQVTGGGAAHEAPKPHKVERPRAGNGDCSTIRPAPPAGHRLDPQTKDLVVARPEGLYCPPGDFHIDPWQPVA